MCVLSFINKTFTLMDKGKTPKWCSERVRKIKSTQNITNFMITLFGIVGHRPPLIKDTPTPPTPPPTPPPPPPTPPPPPPPPTPPPPPPPPPVLTPKQKKALYDKEYQKKKKAGYIKAKQEALATLDKKWKPNEVVSKEVVEWKPSKYKYSIEGIKQKKSGVKPIYDKSTKEGMKKWKQAYYLKTSYYDKHKEELLKKAKDRYTGMKIVVSFLKYIESL